MGAYLLIADALDDFRRLKHSELVELIGYETSLIRCGADGLSYSISVWVRWHDIGAEEISVSASVAPADWGASHDRLDESFVAPRDDF